MSSTVNPQPALQDAELVRMFNAPKAGNSDLDDETVKAAVKDFASTEEGAEIMRVLQHALEAHHKDENSAVAPPSAVLAQGGAGAFKSKAHANGSIASVLAWQQVTMQCDSVHKSWKGSAFCLNVPGAGFLTGDLYYNDVNDLNNNCWAFLGAVGPWAGLTFCRSQNLATAFATFQCFNLGIGNAGACWLQGSFS